jgi:hypothetical protein
VSEQDFDDGGYVNGISGFLCSVKNADDNLNNGVSGKAAANIDYDNATPIVIATSNSYDSTVVGVVGYIESNSDSTYNRNYYWGAFGTTVHDIDQRLHVTSSGFTSVWVVMDQTNPPQIGDYLTSHESGAAQIQMIADDSGNLIKDTIYRNYTIGKLTSVKAKLNSPTSDNIQIVYGKIENKYNVEIKLMGVLLNI